MNFRLRQFRFSTAGGIVALVLALYAGEAPSGIEGTQITGRMNPDTAAGVVDRLRGLSAWLDSGSRAIRSPVTLGLRN